MTLGDIATKARSLVNLNSTSYTNADLLIDLNIWWQKVATWILEAQDDSDFDDSSNTTYPQYTFPLVDLQRDYSIASTYKILKIKRLDITYDGVTWYRATPIDDSMVKQGLPPVSGATSMDATVDARFVKEAPRYDYKYGSLWIYPRAQTGDAANGAQAVAEFTREVTPITLSDLTTGTLVPGFDGPFHPVLAYGCASEKATQFSMPQLPKLMGEIEDYKIRLQRHYGSKDGDIKLTLLPNDVPEDSYNR